MSRWVIIPDLQVPLHDERFMDVVCAWIAANGPWDGLANVGDEADCTAVGRWVRGRRGEYAGNLQADLDETNRVLGLFRQAIGPDTPYILMRSNHTDRIKHYLQNAPALDTLECLDYRNLVGLDEWDIQFKDKPYVFTSDNGGWILAHGDEGSLLRSAGGTALGLAKRYGKSTVCGHTHRAGIQHDHQVVNGRITRHLFGVETGHGMDLKKASYLKGGYGNWQQAITVIDDGIPILLPYIRSKIGGTQ